MKLGGLSQDLLKDRQTLRKPVSKWPVEGPAGYMMPYRRHLHSTAYSAVAFN